jgi:hypothetical protein
MPLLNMNEKSPSTSMSQSELVDASVYIDKAVKIANGRITDENISRCVTNLFETIRLLCISDRQNISCLRFLAGQLLIGVAEAGYSENQTFLVREIEYVRNELRHFLSNGF